MAGSDSSRKPKKTLVVAKDSKFPSLLRLQFKEGGKVPDHLSGLYSGYPEAQRAIDYYVLGYGREKIYPRAPAKQEAPSEKKDERSVKTDGEAKDNSRV